MRTILLAVVLGALGALACGDSTDGAGGSGGDDPCAMGHCSGQQGPYGCMQYGDSASGMQAYEDACDRGGGTWGAGLCPERGVGGCRSRNGTACVTSWYGDELTADQARTVCQNAGGTYVAP